MALFYLFIFFFFCSAVQGQASLNSICNSHASRKLQHPTKTHCVWGGGKKCNKQFIRLFLIDYGEVIHACSKVFAISHLIFTRKPWNTSELFLGYWSKQTNKLYFYLFLHENVCCATH